MVWGNLATGYWLGGAAAAGLHWIELGRATLSSTGDNINVEGATPAYPTADWTENFSAATPTSWVENSSSGYANNLEPYKSSSNGLWFDLDDFTGKVVGTLDLQNAGLMSANADDSKWILRFKINFNGLTNGTGSMWVGLSNNTDASRDTQKFVGVRFKSNSAGMTTGASRYTSGSALSGSSGENDTGSTAATYTTGTDYYVTIQRTGTGTDSTRTATVQATIRTGSHTGTVLGTSTDDIYAQTGLRYFKVMNNRLSSGTAGQHNGYIYDVEFYDGINRFPADLTAKPYTMVLGHVFSSGDINRLTRFNEDTGNNYANRYNSNGGSDSTSTSGSSLFTNSTGPQLSEFGVAYISSVADQEKLMISHAVGQGGAGAGNDPDRRDTVGKWANTSDNITSVNCYNSDTGDYASGSEVVVLGYDPDDEEGTSVWEELASVTLGSAGDTLSSGTFTPKKYLRYEIFCINDGACEPNVRVGNSSVDSGNNYARRSSYNGGTDSTATSNSYFAQTWNSAATNNFIEGFIINVANKEKLGISQGITQNTAGAGNAPTRAEVVSKWANTSNQINIIDVVNTDTGNIAAGSSIKVWGFD